MVRSLSSMQAELRTIKVQIQEVATSLNKAKGIGAEKCIDLLTELVNDCEISIKNLDTVARRREEEEAKKQALLERLERERLEKERQLNGISGTTF
jgi:hypothetical protein